jgi:signal transduction histidine kinase
MNKTASTFKAIPQTTLRRLRNTPSYFFLVWRWTFWLFALIDIVTTPTLKYGPLLLVITFLQALLATLYTPVFHVFLPNLTFFKLFFDKLPLATQHKEDAHKRQRRMVWGRHRPQPLAEDEEADIVSPLTRTRKFHWNLIIYGADVLICGLVTYFGGPWGAPFFGYSSPFYRYGFSAIFAAAFAYRYRGGLAAALIYELFILLGILLPAPGAPAHLIVHIDNIIGSFLDVPLAALLAAYMASLLSSYTRSKRREQDNARRRRALLNVSDTLLKGASDRYSLLQHSLEQIRKGGHFGRLVLALVDNRDDGENNGLILPVAPRFSEGSSAAQVEIETYMEAGVAEAVAPEESQALLEQVIQTGEKLISFKQLSGDPNQDDEAPYGIARLYLPFFKEGQLYMVLGAESLRQTPFDEKPEDFLTIVGVQLLTTLENIRLTEQTAELAASAERGRIAREIHDGIAQLIYMLSLNIETCVALAQRLEREAEFGELSKESTEEANLISPLAPLSGLSELAGGELKSTDRSFVGGSLHPLTERLEKLVTISKQALWETRHYMFSLKPLISGTTNLTQMLANQLHEFEAISGLPVRFEIEGSEESLNNEIVEVRSNRRHTTAQVGAAIFRITQEALTNAYKHANATDIQVYLRHLPGSVEVEICDNGKGLDRLPYSNNLSANGEQQPVYSGRGMHGMRERTEELGGTFEVKQIPGSGVSIRARIPR